MLGLLLLLAAAGGVFVLSGSVAPRLRAEERTALALAVGPTALGWSGLPAAVGLGVDARSAGLAGAVWAALAGALLWRYSGLRASLLAEGRDLIERLRGAPRGATAALGALVKEES